MCAPFVAGLSRSPEGMVTVNKASSSVVGWVPGQRPHPSDGCVLGSKGRVEWAQLCYFTEQGKLYLCRGLGASITVSSLLE